MVSKTYKIYNLYYGNSFEFDLFPHQIRIFILLGFSLFFFLSNTNTFITKCLFVF